MPKQQRRGGGMLKLLACTEALSVDDEGASTNRQLIKGKLLHSDNNDGLNEERRTKDSFLRRALDSLLNDKSNEKFQIVSTKSTKKRLNLPTEATSSPPAAGGRSVGRNLRKRLVVALLEDSGQLSSTSDSDGASQRTADGAASIKHLLRRLNDVIDDYSGSSSSGVGSNNTSNSNNSGCDRGGSEEVKIPSLVDRTTASINLRPLPPPPPPPPPPRRYVQASSNDAIDSNALAASNNRIIKQSVQEETYSWSADDNDEPQCSATVVAKPIVPTTVQQWVSNSTVTNNVYAQSMKSTNMTSKIKKTQIGGELGYSVVAAFCDQNKLNFGPCSSQQRRSRHHRGFRRYRCAQPQAASNYYVAQAAHPSAPAASMAMTSSCCHRHCCCCPWQDVDCGRPIENHS